MLETLEYFSKVVVLSGTDRLSFKLKPFEKNSVEIWLVVY